MTWLVTGGAGYIGAHVVRSLLARDLQCVVYDDFSTGRREVVPPDVALVEGDVADTAKLRATMAEHRVEGVLHLAAKKSAPESVADPLMYYRENVGGLESVLRAMRDADVHRFVLSSSCSVYGMPDLDVVEEDAPTAPLSPYGETKLACEWLTRAARPSQDLSFVMLRYFNVAGAGAPELGDVGVFNLLPLALEAVTNGRRPKVFGTDYPTPDGSCVRDYVHVVDLAEAHVAAAEALRARDVGEVFNVGRGEGVSVLQVIDQVIDAVRRISGADVEPEACPRRAGDPARIVGSTRRIHEAFGWKARLDLDDMVTSAYEAWQQGTHR